MVRRSGTPLPSANMLIRERRKDLGLNLVHTKPMVEAFLEAEKHAAREALLRRFNSSSGSKHSEDAEGAGDSTDNLQQAKSESESAKVFDDT